MARNAILTGTLAASALLALVGLPSGVFATDVTVRLPASKDNSLYQNEAGALSNGAGTSIFVGKTGQIEGEALRRALIAFDIRGSIPPGAEIVSASLTLSMTRTIADATEVKLHRVLKDWGEGGSDAGDWGGAGAVSKAGDATWIHNFYDSSTWDSPGGDFSPEPCATQSVEFEGSYTWESEGMVADVQDWLDHPDRNFGWLLHGKEETEPLEVSAKRFASREWPDPGDGNTDEPRPPELVVTYATSSETVFQRGDADADGARNLSDAVATLLFLFSGGAEPPCHKGADANDTGTIDLTDAVYLLRFLFAGGPPPPAPFAGCGTDPSADDLSCNDFPACG